MCRPTVEGQGWWPLPTLQGCYTRCDPNLQILIVGLGLMHPAVYASIPGGRAGVAHLQRSFPSRVQDMVIHNGKM